MGGSEALRGPRDETGEKPSEKGREELLHVCLVSCGIPAWLPNVGNRPVHFDRNGRGKHVFDNLQITDDMHLPLQELWFETAGHTPPAPYLPFQRLTQAVFGTIGSG